jgi:hypothetical protein
MTDSNVHDAAPEARRESGRRHEVDVERRRAHPGEPRRPFVTDRPPSRDDRRGAHGYAREGRGR